MVDAHGTRMLVHEMNHFAVYLIAGGLQVVRVERRLTPILALLVVEIRRTAYGDATCRETFRIRPGIGTETMHAHGHILDHAPAPCRNQERSAAHH